MVKHFPAALFAVICLLFSLQNTSPGGENHDDRVVRITFVGNICSDGNPGHTVTNGEDPFAAVAGVLKDTDLAVADLECEVVAAAREA